MENGWSFIQPVESTNYVLNPSAEAASNFSSLGSAVTRSSTYQKYGRYSYRVQTGGNGQGLSLTLSTLTNSVHFATARIRGRLPNNLRFIIGTGLKTPVLIEKIDDDWNLYGVQFNATESNGRTELRIIQQGNGIGDFYVDGIQVEPLGYWTTYIDGTQEGCAWNGVEHAATSTRSGLSLAGGQVKDFYDDYGFLVEKVIGAGSPPQSVNVDEYAILPGGEVNSIKILPRDMTIVGKFIADDELELHDKQQALHLALSSENYPGNQSFKLRFSSARVQKEIKVNYKGGLEGELNAFYCETALSGDSNWETMYKWVEKASIQLQAPDPYWYETGESAANLDGNDSATFRYVAGRLKSTGQWSNLGLTANPTTGGTIRAVLRASDGTIYFGGEFTGWNGQAGYDYVVRYNPYTNTWSRVGGASDFNDTVWALAESPSGLIIIGGEFSDAAGIAAADRVVSYDGTNVRAIGTPLVGTANIVSVRALTYDLLGNLLIGGQFENWANIAAADGFVLWNGMAYSAVGAPGFTLAFTVYTIAIDSNNYYYVGGDISSYMQFWNGTAWATVGGVAPNSPVEEIVITSDNIYYIFGQFTNLAGIANADYAASFNGTSFSALSSGLDNPAYDGLVAPNNTVYISGQFTQAGALTLSDRIVRWNGYAFAHLDVILPGLLSVWAMDTGVADPVISNNFDLWLGFDTTGTGYFAGKTTVTNEGNALVYPQIIFKRTGGTVITIETLKNESTGKELLFNYDLLDGEKLTIDLTPTKKSIVSNYFGSRLDAILANSDFGTWTLKPGSNDVTCFTADNFALYPSSLDSFLLWKDRYKSYN